MGLAECPILRVFFYGVVRNIDSPSAHSLRVFRINLTHSGMPGDRRGVIDHIGIL
jgi:hypothetical protein